MLQMNTHVQTNYYMLYAITVQSFNVMGTTFRGWMTMDMYEVLEFVDFKSHAIQLKRTNILLIS